MKKIYFLLIALCFITTTKAQIVNIPDANFKAKLLSASASNTVAKNLNGDYFKIDANDNGQIEVAEAAAVSYLGINNASINNVQGLSAFINLTSLFCTLNHITTLDLTSLANLDSVYCGNNWLTSINVNGMANLKTLFCPSNQLTSLNLESLSSIEYITCGGNPITVLKINNLTTLKNIDLGNCLVSSLDISNLTNLTGIFCSYNYLTSLDVSNQVHLGSLYFDNNQISSIDLSNKPQLIDLGTSNNPMYTLDLSNLPNLELLGCNNNVLSSLDLTALPHLRYITCKNNLLTTIDLSHNSNIDASQVSNFSNNHLQSIILKNGHYEGTLNFSNNPSLHYICVDDSEISQITQQLTANGYNTQNVVINSYCSFVPGGDFYTIQGNQKLDSNANGCDALDIIVPNLKFSITNGVTIGSFVSNATGNYAIPVQKGTHIITPGIENPNFFNVSPTNVTVDFPTQASPFTQDFCITPNGSHSDLEITLLPILPAIPGFDAICKIVYKNKGNTTQSGAVNLTFNQALLDLVIANPSATTKTTNNLSWDFTDLKPFETREITFTLNVNSPMEIPAVNSGAILAYNATITSTATDETPIDNTFAFNQTVVNSFDPNDKTCLEGTTISPSLIGQYVHYMIRFENSGTANARNIVVKDMIDLSKFDISTLVPTSASHSFVTNITAGNKVEFIFENINLPFDDANNDGYIAFKIKTLPTLKVGDTFTNDASIYFDYNFPVVTKPASSTFKTLGTQDFEFDTYFTLYPNPAKSVLNISSKETIEVKSISIYNALGQLVLVVPNAEKVSKIDVSSLTSGNYFIKINSDKGRSNARFIKE